MPELPEVETTLRGIAPHVVDRTVKSVIVRQRQLRHPVSRGVTSTLPEQRIVGLRRRAKYLLFDTRAGSLIVHLGMSGSLKMVPRDQPPGAHDHVDIAFTRGRTLRFRDPRRFGCVLWSAGDPLRHPLLRALGPEPLADEFDAAHLAAAARGRKVAIKNLIMNGHVVVGVGNIYASEALYRAGIHPKRSAGRIATARLARLVDCIRDVLQEAIVQGGTSLRDFTGGDGEPGYFGQRLEVYGRAGEPCRRCAAPLRQAPGGPRAGCCPPRRRIRAAAGSIVGRRLAGQPGVFDEQLPTGFHPLRVQRNAVHRTYFLALRRIEMPHALGAFVRIDVIDLGPHVDRLVGALGFAHIAIDALIGDFQRHRDACCGQPSSRWAEKRATRAAFTIGGTNLDTSPPKDATSRTSVDEM